MVWFRSRTLWLSEYFLIISFWFDKVDKRSLYKGKENFDNVDPAEHSRTKNGININQKGEILGCLCRSLSLYICGLALDRSQEKPCLVMSRLIKYLWAFFHISNRQTKVLYSFVSLTYSWSIFRYIHTLRDCKKTLHVFLNKNVMSVNLITAAMLELTKRFSPLDSYPYLASPQTSLGVRSSFLPHRRRPWGSNECVTNEPQRTSAGKLTPIQPHANSENSGCLDTWLKVNNYQGEYCLIQCQVFTWFYQSGQN